jgi:hypothetical protein
MFGGHDNGSCWDSRYLATGIYSPAQRFPQRFPWDFPGISLGFLRNRLGDNHEVWVRWEGDSLWESPSAISGERECLTIGVGAKFTGLLRTAGREALYVIDQRHERNQLTPAQRRLNPEDQGVAGTNKNIGFFIHPMLTLNAQAGFPCFSRFYTLLLRVRFRTL